MIDALAEVAGPEGTVSAADREKIRLDTLARCVVGWQISENGEPVPFNHGSVVRLLKAGDIAGAKAALVAHLRISRRRALLRIEAVQDMIQPDPLPWLDRV